MKRAGHRKYNTEIIQTNGNALINGKPIPPPGQGNTLGAGRGFVLISVLHGWSLFFKLLLYTFRHIKGTVRLL